MLVLLTRISLLQASRRLRAVLHQSRLLTALIVGFIMGYVVLSFWIFHKGLTFVEQFPGLGPLLTERMIFLLFAFLFVLLLLSSLIISYTNFFRNRETAFLLTLPIAKVQVFRWKSIESTLLASWAFLFLLAPLLAAYGLTRGVPWHFYAVTVVFLSLFIVLPSLAGSWIAVGLGRFMDRRVFQVCILAAAGVFLAGAVFWWRAETVTDEMLETRVLEVLDRLLVKTQFANFPFLPSYWLSSGIQNWAEGAFTGAVFFCMVLLSHSLFFGYLSFTRMGDPFYEALSTVQSRGSVLGRWTWFQAWQQRRASARRMRGPLELVFGLCFWLRRDTRAFLVKDVRIFWRDTSQWGQTVVLFGLLGVYILNLRHFSHQLSNPFWINLVSFLNLGACSLNLATLTTRFVYPQFSLEGKRLWIVGMAPLGLRRMVLTKLGLASCASLVVTLGLITLSCGMLHVATPRLAYFALAVVIMTFTLNGLAVGLGVLYPNFKEDNPSKIVSGFGGTFCLVMSFLYIVASVTLLALGAPWSLGGGGGSLQTISGIGGFLLLSLLLGLFPMILGFRRLAQFEI